MKIVKENLFQPKSLSDDEQKLFGLLNKYKDKYLSNYIDGYNFQQENIIDLINFHAKSHSLEPTFFDSLKDKFLYGIEYVIDNGFDVNIGTTGQPLRFATGYAIHSKNQEDFKFYLGIVKLLLQKGAKITTKQYDAFSEALKSGNKQLINIFIDYNNHYINKKMIDKALQFAYEQNSGIDLKTINWLEKIKQK